MAPVFATRTGRFGGEGSTAWDIHTRARRDRANGADVVIMSVGDYDFPTAQPIMDEACRALREGDTHYTDTAGIPALREQIAADHTSRTGQTVSADNVIVAAGTQNGLYSVAQCLLDPGDEAIALEPMYVTYEATIRSTGAEIIPVSTPKHLGFRPDPAEIEAAISPRTRALFFSSPNNPTGVVFGRPELEVIADIARRHDLWVVADEVYGDLVFDGAMLSIASLPGMAERTATTSSLSKSHAMTGWRVGWVVGPTALVDHIDRLSLAMHYGLPPFVQAAATVALGEQRAIAASLRDLLRARRDMMVESLRGVPGLELLVPSSGMVMLVDIRSTGIPAGIFVSRLYEDTGVSVLDAATFGPGAAGMIRLSFSISEDDIHEGCQRIARWLGKHVA